MKKSLIAKIVALGAIVALNSCQGIEINTVSEIRSDQTAFTIIASSQGVRTTIDDYQTSWAEGDALSLWHAAAGTSDYQKEGQFTADAAGASTSFSGTVNGSIDPDAGYDWYAVYPYDAELQSPAGDAVDFAGALGMGPVVMAGNPYLLQDGNNSTDHLSGSEFAFAGKAVDVPGSEVPAIDMKPVFSVVKILVTNSGADPLHVFSIRLTAPGEPIAGQFAIDFTGDDFSYTPKPGGTFDNVTLEVRPDAAIPQNGSAAYYLTVKPFTADAGTQLKVKVNGYEKTLTLDSDCTFTAGKVKTVKFNYDDSSDLSGEYYIGVTHENGDLYLAEALNYSIDKVDGRSDKNSRIAVGHIVRKDGNTLTVDANMDVCSNDGSAVIGNYVYTFEKMTSGEYAGLYTVKNNGGKYMSVINIDETNLQFKNNPQPTTGDNIGIDSYWAVGRDADGGCYLVAPYSQSGNRVFAFHGDALENGSNDFVRASTYAFSDFQAYPTLYAKDDFTVVEKQRHYVKVTAEQTDWSGKYLFVHLDSKLCLNASIRDESVFKASGTNINSASVTITDDKITSDVTTNSYAFRIEKGNDDLYSIRVDRGMWYVGLFGVAAPTISLKTEEQFENPGEKFENSISYNSNHVEVKVGDALLKCNVGKTLFKYTDGGFQHIQLFELEDL